MTNELAIKILNRMIETGITYDDGYGVEPLTKDEETACLMGKEALEQKTGWIPVSDRLPEVKMNPVTKDYQEYLCTMDYTEVKDVRLIKFDRKHWVHTGSCMDEYVTAWMERPEPYKEG